MSIKRIRNFNKLFSAFKMDSENFEKIVLDKLPEFLDMKQKKDKVKNNLQTLEKAHKIDNDGKLWKMSNE
jgi:hypothetical protein